MAYRCFKCGKKLSWEKDCAGEDVYPALEDWEEGSIISMWRCCDCNIDYEMLIHGKRKEENCGSYRDGD